MNLTILPALLLFLPTQIETTDSPVFSKKLQVRALTATVRIVNPSRRSQGSGVIVGRNGPFVYILTAYHVVRDAGRLEIATFSESSYPRTEKVYRSVRVVAKVTNIRDLALVRLATSDTMPATLPICPVAEIPKGEAFPALTSGCHGAAPTCSVEKVLRRTKVRRKAAGETAYFWELNGESAKGRSGGPLIDKRGYIVGISSGINDGKGYFCHPEEIHEFLRQNGFRWLSDKDAKDSSKPESPR